MDENEKDEFTLKEMLFGDDKEYEEYKIYLEEEKRKEDEKRRIEEERSRRAIEYANRKNSVSANNTTEIKKSVMEAENLNSKKIIIPDEVENADTDIEPYYKEEPIKNYYNKDTHSNSNPIRMHEYRKNMNNYLNYENMSEMDRKISNQSIEYVYRHEIAKKGWIMLLAIFFGFFCMFFALHMNSLHDEKINEDSTSSQVKSISAEKYTKPDPSVNVEEIKANGGRIMNYAYSTVISYTSPIKVDIPTYYGSTKQDNVKVCVYYPTDKRFRINSVNSVVIEYKNLTQDNVEAYEKTLLKNGYKEDINYTKGTLFVKQVDDTSYGFSLRENNTFTYGITWRDINEALNYYDYSENPMYTQK